MQKNYWLYNQIIVMSIFSVFQGLLPWNFINKYECTMNRELADAAADALGRSFVYTHQMAALFCVKWRHGCHLESATSSRKSDSVSRCVFTWNNNLVKFHPDLIWNDGALGFFEDGRPNKKMTTRWVAILWDQFHNLSSNHAKWLEDHIHRNTENNTLKSSRKGN